MKNPYKILGVAQHADAQQLREAYQALWERHDGNVRRMREINDAWEAILLSRGGENEALARLESVPEDQRDSEWHYRMGCAQRERGWLEEAEARFARAALFGPDNRKYRAALKRARGDRARKSGKKADGDCAQGCFEGGMECCCELICS